MDLLYRSTTHVSPARACSTMSWRRITSIERGRDPAGISLEVSCILTLCQSANLLSCLSNAHFPLFRHVALTHIVGCSQYGVCWHVREDIIYIHDHNENKKKGERIRVYRTSVYLNCCSTFFMTLPHSKHLNVPKSSSGRTSLVRVTTPVTETSFPISEVDNSLSLW